MAEINLFEAREKLRWAEKHFDPAWREIKPFEERDDHTISVDVNRDTGNYVFRVWNLPTPDPEWGLRIGDCLHNARAALDYIMVRLYALATGQDPRDIEAIQFPVCDTPDRWKGSPAVQKFRKEPTLSGYLTRVEEMQPFNENNPSIWGNRGSTFPNDAFLPIFLDKLSRWDNIDKHRVIHAAWLGSAQHYGPTKAPKSYGEARQTREPGPFENGAEIGRWEFEPPLPADPWEPTEVDMKEPIPL
jgi:hypothetical protein